MTYRNNERSYMAAKNKIILLQKTEADLSKMIDEKEKAILIMKEAKRSAEIGKVVSNAAGGMDGLGKDVATLEYHREKIGEAVEHASLVTSEMFTEDPSLSARTDNEFGAAMAADEARRATMASAGISESEMDEQETAQKSEFASLVGNDTDR